MKRRALTAGLVMAGVAVALSGCSIANAITPPVETQLYPTAADGKTSSATVPLPAWVPDDATMIRIKTNHDTNDVILTFNLSTAANLGSACDPSIAANTPGLNDTWWPQAIPMALVTCQDGWHLLSTNYSTQYFAWKP